MLAAETADWKGRFVSDYVGQASVEPRGKVIGGSITPTSVMLLDIETPDGEIIKNTPLHLIKFQAT